MGLLTVSSAKGSPGVTTAALLFGALWPRPTVVAECDPSGGDIAWRMPSATGQPLDVQEGLLALVAAGRRSFHAGLVHAHSQQIVGGQDVLVGVTAPEQSSGINRWRDLGAMFGRLPGVDVIADLGRIGASTPQNTLLTEAAANVFIVDALPSNVVHLRERMGRVHEALGTMGAPMHVVVVAPPKRSRAVREVADVLARSGTPIVATHHLAYDEAGAGFFLGQVRGSPRRTHLVRSAEPIVTTLAAATQGYFLPADAPVPLDPGSAAQAAVRANPAPGDGARRAEPGANDQGASDQGARQ